MNKNLVIGVLAAMLVLGSLWGQVGNKTNKAARHELKAVTAELTQVKQEGVTGHDLLLAKIDKMGKVLKNREKQLVKARHELVGLRKNGKALESRIAERDAAVAALTQEKNQLSGQLAALKKSLAEATGSEQQQTVAIQQQMATMKKMILQKDKQLAVAMKALSKSKAVKQELHSTAAREAQGIEELQAKLEKAETMIQELQEKATAAEEAAEAAMNQSKLAREYESARAQIIGLEKIVEEKNATIEETSKELDHWKVNMDVLLSKISDQQDNMQELREENRELSKELAVKNKELADVNEQLIQTPVPQQ